jgi:large subunit ribosomal protein L33
MASENRIIIKLTSKECPGFYYTTIKNRRNTTEKLVLRKYCPQLRKHVDFREEKI